MDKKIKEREVMKALGLVKLKPISYRERRNYVQNPNTNIRYAYSEETHTLYRFNRTTKLWSISADNAITKKFVWHICNFCKRTIVVKEVDLCRS